MTINDIVVVNCTLLFRFLAGIVILALVIFVIIKIVLKKRQTEEIER
ncbi:MAG: hypothetical protein ACRCUS_05335 [Anaerovoracaceae bacterium]